MKKYSIACLFIIGFASQVGAVGGPYLGDSYFKFSQFLNEAGKEEEDKEELKPFLSIMWQLLPSTTKQEQDKKATFKRNFNRIFGEMPDEVNFEAYGYFARLLNLCTAGKRDLALGLERLGKKINQTRGDLAVRQKAYDLQEQDQGKLREALNDFSNSYAALAQALFENIEYFGRKTHGSEDPDIVAQQEVRLLRGLQTAYKDYQEAVSNLNEIAYSLGMRELRLDNPSFNSIVEAEIKNNPQYEALEEQTAVTAKPPKVEEAPKKEEVAKKKEAAEKEAAEKEAAEAEGTATLGELVPGA
jgi:hypothetical protein